MVESQQWTRLIKEIDPFNKEVHEKCGDLMGSLTFILQFRERAKDGEK